MKIDRTATRGLVAERLRERLLRNELSPGARLDQVAIARELGVSATPVREALLELHAEGLVDTPVGRGFRVRALDAAEAAGLYDVLAGLEARALRTAPPDRSIRRALARANERLRRAEKPDERIAADAAWHEALLARDRNAVARELRANLRQRAQRYERAYMADPDRAAGSADAHDAILAALDRGEVDRAAERLEANWRDTVAALVGRMTEDPPGGAAGDAARPGA